MILLFLHIFSVATFYVCGYYCGSGWCADVSIDETSCVDQNYWGSDSDGSCVDECCKAHDYCCGAGDRSQCNSQIVNCAYYCSGPCADAVWLAMKAANSVFCCGGPCDSNLIADVERRLGERRSGATAVEQRAKFVDAVQINE